MECNEIADLRVAMATCSTDKERRIDSLETWKKQQNGDIRRIRTKTTAILLSVILLLIGVVTNIVVNRSQPDIHAIVAEVVDSLDRP